MGQIKRAALPLALVSAVLLAIGGASPVAAGSYVVREGDTLWAISHQQRVSIAHLIQANGISNPDRIYPGQRLALGDTPSSAPTAPAAAPAAVRGSEARRLVHDAAVRHDLNPNFALAVAYWESGLNQGVVSNTGAVGMMQIEPYTAVWAGPALLHRKVDIANPNDNADLGTALLRHYLDVFNGDPKLALAAYYQGERGTRKYGIYPSSRAYVDGIWALRNRFQAGG